MLFFNIAHDIPIKKATNNLEFYSEWLFWKLPFILIMFAKL